MHQKVYYLVNSITAYRMLAAPVGILLAVQRQESTFKWLLAVSFMTDAIDGFLARRYGVTSIAGSRLDSLADDLTIGVAMAGIVVFKPEFLVRERLVFIGLLVLFMVQNILALLRYRRVTSFHTYAAKIAAILQAIFLVSFFFVKEPLYGFFYITASATALELTEEIILTLRLPAWEANVKGLFWVMIRKKRKIMDSVQSGPQSSHTKTSKARKM